MGIDQHLAAQATGGVSVCAIPLIKCISLLSTRLGLTKGFFQFQAKPSAVL